MSQIDVRNAKLALATRLRHWGTPGDTLTLAAGFIDDLVAQGWEIAAFRETRPRPPRVGESCATCGKTEDDCRRNPHGDHEFTRWRPRDVDLSPVVAELKDHVRPPTPPQERTVTT